MDNDDRTFICSDYSNCNESFLEDDEFCIQDNIWSTDLGFGLALNIVLSLHCIFMLELIAITSPFIY